MFGLVDVLAGGCLGRWMVGLMDAGASGCLGWWMVGLMDAWAVVDIWAGGWLC